MSSWEYHDKATVFKNDWRRCEDGDGILNLPDMECELIGEENSSHICENWRQFTYRIQSSETDSITLIDDWNLKVQKWDPDDGSYDVKDLEPHHQYRVVIRESGKEKYYRLVETTKEELDAEQNNINREYYEDCKKIEERKDL